MQLISVLIHIFIILNHESMVQNDWKFVQGQLRVLLFGVSEKLLLLIISLTSIFPGCTSVHIFCVYLFFVSIPKWLCWFHESQCSAYYCICCACRPLVFVWIFWKSICKRDFASVLPLSEFITLHLHTLILLSLVYIFFQCVCFLFLSFFDVPCKTGFVFSLGRRALKH